MWALQPSLSSIIGNSLRTERFANMFIELRKPMLQSIAKLSETHLSLCYERLE